MGDNWHHSIVIEAIGPGQPDTKYPRYIDGARRGPPEDCGGTPGFENFLEAIANPKHPDHAELIEWYIIDQPWCIMTIGRRKWARGS